MAPPDAGRNHRRAHRRHDLPRDHRVLLRCAAQPELPPRPPLRLLYPHTGNFLAFVANLASHRLLCRSLSVFRRATTFPARGLVAPATVPGVDWSDHWSFWREGYPALMITDTAPFRYPWYHSHEDTPDKVCWPQLAEVTLGLARMIGQLAGVSEKSLPILS